MPELTLVILSAGNSTRFGSNVKKQWLRIGEKPLWQFVADRLATMVNPAKIVITAHADEARYMRQHGSYEIVLGGESRQESLQNALHAVETP